MLKTLTFHGEVFEHNLEDQSLNVNIKEPFWTFGKKFNLKGSSAGLGLNIDALNYAKSRNLKIVVTVHGKRYVTHWKTWLTNGRMWKLSNGVEVNVLQWNKNYFVTLS